MSFSSSTESASFKDQTQETTLRLGQENSSSAEIQRFDPNIQAKEEGYDDAFERAESTNAISRELSRALTNSPIIDKTNDTSSSPIPSMGLNKTIPLDYPDPEPYTVSFDGPEDPLHPHNWEFRTKLITALTSGINTAATSFGSSVFSSAVSTVAKEYHVGRVVATIGVSGYILGFATGPVVWAPLSEIYGRRPVLLISAAGFVMFQFAVATAKDIQTIIICRILSGLLGAGSFVIVPAALADMFNNEQRGAAVTIFSMNVFMMPMFAPIVGQFATSSYLGWRWTSYVTGIIGAIGLVTTLLFSKETHHPIVLVNKAKEIKRKSGNWLIHAPHDEFELTLNDLVEKNITRPLRMLATEPILLFISLYNAFIYAILYLLLTAYPIVFQEGYGMRGGVSELPYIAVAIGMISGAIWCFSFDSEIQKAVRNNEGRPVPELRLHPIFLASIVFPIGLIWFTWSGYYHEKVHWMVPTAAGVFIGFGLFTIFTSTMNYYIDVYLVFAASAIAANTFMRSALACAFPLFSVQMFHKMGVNWAGLMLALVAVALIPVPILFFKFGKALRSKSKYTLNL